MEGLMAISGFPVRGCNRLAGHGSRLDAALYRFILAVSLGLPGHLASNDQQNGPMDLSPSPGEIVPINLDVVPSCMDSSPYSLNNLAYPGSVTVGGASNCPWGYVPYTYRGGSWSSVPHSYGGWVNSVSDDDPEDPTLTLVVMQNDFNSAELKMSGQGRRELPLLPGTDYAGLMVVTAQADYVVGSNVRRSTGERRAVRWRRDGSTWSPPVDIGSGEAVAVSEDGSVVIGNNQPQDINHPNAYYRDGGPWVWTASPSGGQRVALDPEAVVYDISHDGTMIVGARPLRCSSSKCTWYPGPVYWEKRDGGWTLHDLEALDGVDSVAHAIAKVDGTPVIAGQGYTAQQGGILRPVVWIPGPDGQFGAPTRLQPSGGAFESWAKAVDVNRNGLVLGWSDRSASDWTTVSVLWDLSGESSAEIGAGHSGAWFNPATSGQGLLIDVDPVSEFIFLGWFTYTGRDSTPPNEQHWYTAQGHYVGNQAILDLHESVGGRFDNPQAVETRKVGQVTLTFTSCTTGSLGYDIETSGLSGSFPLERVIPGSENLCEDLAKQANPPAGVDLGPDGAWYAPATEGQGFLFDAHVDGGGDTFVFAAWFTYGDSTDSGQRWLTAQGTLQDEAGELEVYETGGGSFDDPQPVDTVKVGSLNIDFSDCESAVIGYSIDGGELAGTIEAIRVLPAKQADCR